MEGDLSRPISPRSDLSRENDLDGTIPFHPKTRSSARFRVRGSEHGDEPNTAPAGFDDNGDPLSRKLELAEEFQRIGDKDGARDLLREVLATASGATKTKAQGMLDRIS